MRWMVLPLLMLLGAPVLADYMLPETDARLLFVVDEWKLSWEDAKDEGSPTVTLTFERNGKLETWGVDEFWLADRIAIDSICTGSHREKMVEPSARRELDRRGEGDAILPWELRIARARPMVPDSPRGTQLSAILRDSACSTSHHAGPGPKVR